MNFITPKVKIYTEGTKDSKREISQEKWFKSLEHNIITIKEQLYTLKITSNKRHLIYDSNNKLINTKKGGD